MFAHQYCISLAVLIINGLGNLMTKTKVLFLAAGDIRIPSARFRLYQLLPFLRRLPEVEIVGVVNLDFRSVWDRFRVLPSFIVGLIRCDTIFLQKRLLPVTFTHVLAARRRLIYDYDDALYHSITEPAEPVFEKVISHLNAILSHADTVVAGNQYIADYAANYARRVEVIPTVVLTEHTVEVDGRPVQTPDDVEIFEPLTAPVATGAKQDRVTIGWIGSPENNKWLDQVGPALRQLQEAYDVSVTIVSGRKWRYPGLSIVNKRWRLEDEVSDIQSFDIGIMPLDATIKRLHGKCGFKIIAYMATGVVPVASAVGVNSTIIDHGQNGFLIHDDWDWKPCLEELVRDPALRQEMAANARRKIVEQYSVNTVLERYKSLLTYSRF